MEVWVQRIKYYWEHKIKMEAWAPRIKYYLEQKATINIYSSPNFILETFLTIFIVAIHFLLYWDVTGLVSKSLEKTSEDNCHDGDESIASDASRSTCHSTYQRCNRFYSKNFGSMLSPVYQTAVDYSKYMMTPDQYVKMEKKRITSGENGTMSLTTLCKNVINQKYSSQTLQKQLELAKEHLQCRNTSAVEKYVGQTTSLMTKSLFDMLEELIIKTSLANPIPFKGDITTLASEVADISKETRVAN